MWVASKHGFFSIVRKDDEGEALWHVRARMREDLENLKEEAGLEKQIHESPNADYRYRVVVGRDGFVCVVTALAASVDYPNFKSEVGKRPDQAPKLPIYEGWWFDMARLQNGTGSGGRGLRPVDRGPAFFDDDLLFDEQLLQDEIDLLPPEVRDDFLEDLKEERPAPQSAPRTSVGQPSASSPRAGEDEKGGGLLHALPGVGRVAAGFRALTRRAGHEGPSRCELPESRDRRPAAKGGDERVS